ncbi:MAG: hydrogenase maturation protease [Alphaproteobacteria bacterium]
MGEKWLIVGVGNPDRGDDGVGPAVAASLRGRLSDTVQIRAHGGEMTTLLDDLERAEAVILVDAAASGSAPGGIHRFTAHDAPLPETVFAVSTHGFGVSQAIEMARALGTLPAVCVVYAVEGQQFETGCGLSAPVAAAVPEVSERIVTELEARAPEVGHA